MRILRAVDHIAKTVWRRFRVSRYDDFTIAEYFREQGARIGVHCRILLRDLGSEPYLIRIGDHCTIANGVSFITHDGAAWVFTQVLLSVQKFGTIEILDNCFIGQNAILMPDVRVGPNSVVGAGAVVTRHVSPNTVVAGCPARPICTLEEYKRKVLTTRQRQKPLGYMADLRDGVHYAPADIQKEKARYATLLREHLQHLLWDPSRHHGFRPERHSQAPHSSSGLSYAPATHERRRPILAHGEDAGRRWSSE
jgi:acetyltransferase-like isoleucine patch superfamily enzyme